MKLPRTPCAPEWTSDGNRPRRQQKGRMCNPELHSTLVARTDGSSMMRVARSHRSGGSSNSLPGAQWPHYAQHAPHRTGTRSLSRWRQERLPSPEPGTPADVRFLTQSQDAPEHPGSRHRPGQEPAAGPCRVHSAQCPGVQNRPQGAPQPGHDRSAFPSQHRRQTRPDRSPNRPTQGPGSRSESHRISPRHRTRLRTFHIDQQFLTNQMVHKWRFCLHTDAHDIAIHTRETH